MDQFSLPPSPPIRRPEPPPSRMPWLLGLFIVLLILWLLPSFVERIEYALVRGRERAEVENARTELPTPMLSELSRQYALVAKAIGPSVVHVDTVQVVAGSSPGFGSRRHYQQIEGQGSGVIVDEAGYVVTNYHVVEQAEKIRVKLSGDETRAAEVVGMDPLTDIAVLKIPAGGLIAADWGDSDALQVGSLVWAVGNPFGLDRSVTQGIVSAKSRRGLGTSPYQDFLQTDAAVNPGNSGGPLVGIAGTIVGINTAILGDAYQGISFSIPSAVAKDVYERLRAGGTVQRGYLGVGLDNLTPDLAKRLGVKSLQGALVERVERGSPAEAAGIEPGDVIVEWNSHPATDMTELKLLIGRTPVGSTGKAVLVRDGQRMEVDVTVGELPSRPQTR